MKTGQPVRCVLLWSVAILWSVPSAMAENLTSRIVNGVDISIDTAPATVALINQSVYNRTGSLRAAQFCGATLITERWLLTAAHCVVRSNGFTASISSILALAGTTDLDNPVTDPIAIDSLVVHPDYRSVERGSDVALLRLATSPTSPPLPIDTDPIAFDEEAFVAGWGTLKSQQDGEDALLSPILQGATVFMVPGEVCDATYPAQQFQTNVRVDETQICAAVEGGGTDTCQGDSGGPLYRVRDDRSLGLVGVVSYGVGCGLDGLPGVYSGVGATSNRSFIVSTVNANPTVTTTTQIDDPEEEVELPDLLSPLPGGGASGWFLLLASVVSLAWRKQA